MFLSVCNISFVWDKIRNLIHSISDGNICVNFETLVKGHNIDDPSCKIINIVLIVASFAVYKSRIVCDQTNKNISFATLNCFFKEELKYIDVIASRLKLNNLIWKQVINES